MNLEGNIFGFGPISSFKTNLKVPLLISPSSYLVLATSNCPFRGSRGDNNSVKKA